MFERSGEKVKAVARTSFYIIIFIVVILVLGSFITASNLYFGGEIVVTYSLVVAGILLFIGWIQSLFLTAFGDLVDSNVQTMELLQKEEEQKYSFSEVVKLYEVGVLTKEEFDAKKYSFIYRDLNNISELIDIKGAYEKGLLTKSEYESIKEKEFLRFNL